MEYEELVPDVDDYDDDNSLASLFCLFCAVLGRARPSPRQAGGTESCEKHRKKLRITAQFELCFGEDLLSFASFKKQRLSLLCGLACSSGTSWLKVLVVFKNRAVSNCAASAMAASWVKTVTLKISHAEAWNFSAQFFVLQFQNILRNKKDWCSRWVDSCEKQNFL